MQYGAVIGILVMLCVPVGCNENGLLTGLDDDDDGDDDAVGDDDTTPGDDDSGDDDDDTTPGDDDSDDDDTTPGDDDSGNDDDSWDCENLPQGPLPYTVMIGPKATEDFAFDDQGHLIGSETGNLFRSTYTGKATLWVPGSSTDITGIRALPGGDIVFAEADTGNLMRVDHVTGAKSVVLSGMSNPDGLEIDLDGFVFVAEQAAGRVRRIDPDTGAFTILAEDLCEPNGLSFDPTYTYLYVDTWNCGVVWRIQVGSQGQALSVDAWAGQVGTGMHDGMGVDICGNVYICDYGQTRVLRLPSDGSTVETVVDLSANSTWIPNMQWGSGIGGWQTLSLYVLDIEPERMFEVPVGVPDKPRPYP